MSVFQPITLSKAAAQHVKTKLQQRGKGVGLRFGIRVSGCTGYRFEVDYADAIHSTDEVIEQHGVKLIMDKKQLPQLQGTTIHFEQQNLLNQGFEFSNPNIKDSCGCGESFNF